MSGQSRCRSELRELPMGEKNSKKVKRIVRDLQELRGCSYTEALLELRALPEGTWKEHVMRVALEEPKPGAGRG